MADTKTTPDTAKGGKAPQRGDKSQGNDTKSAGGKSDGGKQGASREQHAEAGRQSHKNDK